MNELTIISALKTMGFDHGWVVNEYEIILWDRPEPQPTEKQLIAAGWIKPTNQETPTE